MSTLAKSLKDSNGNIIIPKSRAEQVYCSDNVPVSTKIANLTAMDTTLSNRINAIPSVDKSGIIYNCTCTKSGTVFSLTNSNIPTSATQNIVHVSFIANADFNTGNTFTINNVAYTPISLDMTTPPPDLAFKSGALVSMDININTKQCFFKLGGNSEPPIPEEPTDATSECTIIQAFTSSTVWTVPESKWYRIICVGKSGNGGNGGSRSVSVGYYGGNGAGGNAGGLAAGIHYLEKDTQIQITVNNSITSFGEYMSTSYGGDGGNGATAGGSGGGTGAQGVPSTIIGGAFGGNKVNLDGMTGYAGSRSSSDTYRGYGGWFSSSLAFINQYIAGNSYCAGATRLGAVGSSAPTWVGLVVKISGGGGGGFGGLNVEDDTDYGGTAGGAGSPAVCIIEKTVK